MISGPDIFVKTGFMTDPVVRSTGCGATLSSERDNDASIAVATGGLLVRTSVGWDTHSLNTDCLAPGDRNVYMPIARTGLIWYPLLVSIHNNTR